MKKLISLFAVTTMASTGAMAAVALGGSASVAYDDNGSTGGAVSKKRKRLFIFKFFNKISLSYR